MSCIFFFITNTFAKQLAKSVSGQHFQPSLIFVYSVCRFPVEWVTAMALRHSHNDTQHSDIQHNSK